MLGSNIGKKVTAGTVQDQYNQFLKNKSDTNNKKVLTAEERKLAKRDEMRKRGIMVKADDKDEVPTIIEKGNSTISPWFYTLPDKPPKWKKQKLQKATSVKRKEKTKKETSVTRVDSTKKRKRRGKREKSQKTTSKKESQTSTDDQTSVNTVTKASDTSIETDTKSKKKIEPAAMPKIENKPETKVEEPESKPQPAIAAPTEPEPPSLQSEASSKKEKKAEEASEKKSEKSEIGSEPLASAGSNQDVTKTGSKDKLIDKLSVPTVEKQSEAFEKLDDDDFDKAASTTSDVDETGILKVAPKLLKVAIRHKVLEKCVGADDHEVLAQFFAGKKPLNAQVLATLDKALDKIIDYLQKNNLEIDEDTKKLLKKRDKLKAAMMNEFLVSPQYIPQSWTKKFYEWKVEAESKKNGINWFKILFAYPKHKSFDDGPEDNYGNFNRRHRGLIMGIILGPSDVKSFDETKREEDCQGMFLDTKLIENAAGKDVNTVSERTDTNKK